MIKKIVIIVSIIMTLIISLIVYLNNNSSEEYIPQEEIAKEDFEKATIMLFFQNKETKLLEAESRNINSKDLLLDPYETTLKLLINGPENNNLEKLIPNGTVLKGISLDNYCLKVNFSKEFIEKCPEEENIRKNIINSITNTLTQFNEISSIKILIDGVENLGFPNSEIKF